MVDYGADQQKRKTIKLIPPASGKHSFYPAAIKVMSTSPTVLTTSISRS
jgi:hypothetical protein